MLRIGIDLGTSHIKGVLLDDNNRVSAEAERRVEFVPDIPGIEIDPKAHWEMLCSILRELGKASDITAISFAAAAGNTILLDQDTGKPLTNIISWLDQRGVGADLPSLRGLSPEAMRQLTGWPCVNTFPPAHLAWWREYRPELLDNSFVSQNQDFLQFRLTGQHLIDYSSATPLLLVDQCHEEYAPTLLKRFGLRTGQLPQLAPSGTLIGNLTQEAASATGLSTAVKVMTGSFDHPAAARAAGVLREGQLLLSCGTSWVGFFPCQDRRKLIDNQLLCDPFTHRDNGLWGGMFSISGIGPEIDRYVREYIAPGSDNLFQIFDELAAANSSGGLKIDLTAKYSQPSAPRGQVARAVMEGAAYLLAEKLNTLRQNGIRFKEAVMVGGASRSPIWPEITAGITGLKITSGGKSAGAIGAALLCSK